MCRWRWKASLSPGGFSSERNSVFYSTSWHPALNTAFMLDSTTLSWDYNGIWGPPVKCCKIFHGSTLRSAHTRVVPHPPVMGWDGCGLFMSGSMGWLLTLCFIVGPPGGQHFSSPYPPQPSPSASVCSSIDMLNYSLVFGLYKLEMTHFPRIQEAITLLSIWNSFLTFSPLYFTLTVQILKHKDYWFFFKIMSLSLTI